MTPRTKIIYSVVTIFLLATIVYAGNIDITTYYPVPYGEYNTLYILGGSGDVNGDGKTDILDTLKITNYLRGKETLTHAQYSKADVNGDGRVTKLDADLIAKLEAGLITAEEMHHTKGKYIANLALNVDYDGKVGIGTANPEHVLSIEHPTDSTVIMRRGTERTLVGHFGQADKVVTTGGTAKDFAIRAVADMYFSTGGQRPTMVIKSNGNVGIGTTSPNKKLDVETPHVYNQDDEIRIGSYYSRNSPRDEYYGLGLNYRISGPAANGTGGGDPSTHIVEYRNNTRYDSITLSNGKVGIGTAAPYFPLQVSATTSIIGLQDTDAADRMAMGAYVGFYNKTGGEMGFMGYGNAGSGLLYLENRSGPTVMGLSGNVGIGTTPASSAKLDIQVPSDAAHQTWGGWYEGMRFSNPYHSAITLPAGGLLFGLHYNTNFYWANTTGGYYTMYLTNTGNLYTKGVLSQSINISDIRTKRNIAEIDKGLDEIMKLKPIKYDQLEVNPIPEGDDKVRMQITDKIVHRNMFGLCAQDTYKIIPEVVERPKDESAEVWTIYQEKLIPVMIKAIQEQQAQIIRLSEKVQFLEKSLKK